MIDGEHIDDTIDTMDNTDTGSAVDNTVVNDDANYSELQDRIEGDDSPWYSSSEGKVVTPDGQVVLDSNGNPYKNMADYEAAEKPAEDEKPTAKPKTDETGIELKPSFDTMMESDSMTPERLFELGNVSDYQYNDDLAPAIDESVEVTPSGDDEDPITVAKATRNDLTDKMVQPLKDVRQWLVDEGASSELVDNFINPLLDKQMAQINEKYESDYDAAVLAKAASPANKLVSDAKAKEIKANSLSNIEKLAKAYYPKHGTDAFFSLISGHYDTNDKGEKTFVRGPSSEVMDLITNVASDGRSFKTNEDRDKFIVDNFKKMTADPTRARSIVNIAHYYWLGKQATQMQKASFENGKTAVKEQQTRTNRTKKTKPNSFTPPASKDQYEGMPKMLSAIIKNGG